MLEALDFMRVSRTFEQSSFTDSGVYQAVLAVNVFQAHAGTAVVNYASIAALPSSVVGSTSNLLSRILPTVPFLM